ncbi:MAG TPA: AI-2E family transporter [Thiobacillaceae bacterium]|nr:AI-2E family transporter [Thiobacillaceae bacterium]
MNGERPASAIEDRDTLDAPRRISDAAMPVEQRLRQFAQLSAIAIVIVGCYQVLLPFIPAILFAVVACISTWPLYVRLRKMLRGRSTLAALAMVLLLMVLVIGPSALLALSLTDNVTSIVDAAKALLNHGPLQSPAWLKQMPIIGARLDGYWQALASGGEEAMALFERLLEPAKDLLLVAGKAVGQSLLQMTFAAVIGFFFFRDGDALVQTLRIGLEKLAGSIGAELLATIHGTVAGLVHGIFGTAAAQALVAWIGFLIAGVPGATVLGVATFFLSMLPIGPPLIWGGAAIWLVNHGSIGWAIFMALWGIFAISSIDNFVKPYLISRGSGLPLLLTFLGLFGGIVAFGFIGIFIGPPLLAVGLILVRLWTAPPASESTASGTEPSP